MQTLTDQQGSSTHYRGFRDLEASLSLSCSEKLLRPRPIETDGTLESSPRQESSSHKASPPRRVALKVPTSAETAGKAQEAISQVVQEGEELETRLKEVEQEGENSTELLELETARQEREHSAKRLDPLKAGNSRLGETKEKQGKLAKERFLVLQLESDRPRREAALRQRQAGARKSQDSVASLGRESMNKKSQRVFLDPSPHLMFILAARQSEPNQRDGHSCSAGLALGHRTSSLRTPCNELGSLMSPTQTQQGRREVLTIIYGIPAKEAGMLPPSSTRPQCNEPGSLTSSTQTRKGVGLISQSSK